MHLSLCIKIKIVYYSRKRLYMNSHTHINLQRLYNYIVTKYPQPKDVPESAFTKL